MAIAGNMPTYSSVLGRRAARISAMPYMTMANSSAAATNQNTRLVVSYWAPRSAEAPISTANCNAVNGQRCHQVAEHNGGTSDRGHQQLARGPLLPVDDDAYAREHAVEGNQLASGGQCDVGHVGGALGR